MKRALYWVAWHLLTVSMYFWACSANLSRRIDRGGWEKAWQDRVWAKAARQKEAKR